MVDEMIKMARAAMLNAYNPYSNYAVGACIRSEDDELFAGCNVENVSYSVTICAESAAIGALITAGKKKIKEVVVMGSGDALCTPCGACRQRLAELALTPDIPVHLCDTEKVQQTIKLNQLLPGAFNPEHLEK
ncbi:MAG: cytidine deaminase [Gammaproteobacteria bacterium]|nr:cytidine deaminase [Gammaproteobacteria bacterium]